MCGCGEESEAQAVQGSGRVTGWAHAVAPGLLEVGVIAHVWTQTASHDARMAEQRERGASDESGTSITALQCCCCASEDENKATTTTTMCPPLHLHMHDLSQSSASFFAACAPAGGDPHTVLHDAVHQVCALLAPPSPPPPGPPPPTLRCKRGRASSFYLQPVRSITLYVEQDAGLAYTTGSRLDNLHKELHLSSAYLDRVRSSSGLERLHAELRGVLVHELVHCFQADAAGSAPGGLVEGIADWVRLHASLAPPHWVERAQPRDGHGRVQSKWDAGYERTAFFLDWIAGTRCRRPAANATALDHDNEEEQDERWTMTFMRGEPERYFVPVLNKALYDAGRTAARGKGWADGAPLKETLERFGVNESVDELWLAYQDELREKEKDREVSTTAAAPPPLETHGVIS